MVGLPVLQGGEYHPQHIGTEGIVLRRENIGSFLILVVADLNGALGQCREGQGRAEQGYPEQGRSQHVFQVVHSETKVGKSGDNAQYIQILCIFIQVKKESMTYPTELLKGTLKTIVLKLLADNKKMYGYEITQRVKELTADKIQITEGALYPTLHALETEGLVTIEIEYIGKRIRKYYSLSTAGKAKTREKVKELMSFMDTMITLLDLKPKMS
jgi:DNA-binding PadR family transcriptional regulator